MATRKSSIATKNHILAVSAKLLLEQGYRNTTMKEIADEAEVSVSSVQNFFRSKEGLIAELTRMMFDEQFDMSRWLANNELPLVYTYAVETVIQLMLTERNENLREIYITAYSIPSTVEYIYRRTASELMTIFGDRFPWYEESDFYEMEIGSAALMCGYMARPCDLHFPLHRKIERFLRASLRIYCVREEEIEGILTFIGSLDLNMLADKVMERLFNRLETCLDCDLSDVRGSV